MNNTHLALKLPEIVSNIVSFLVDSCAANQDKQVQRKDIHQCLFVNSLWHYCAFRYMWRSISFEESENGSESLQKFASIVANSPLKKTFHMQEEYSQWITLFSNKHSAPCGDTSIHTMQEEANLQSMYSHHNQYRDTIRSISLWKIKGNSVNMSLQHIAPYMKKLEKLDFYICDNLTDSSLQSLIQNNRFSTLTQLSLAGCCKITDKTIIEAAKFCPKLKHLDLRACGQISDKSISAIAKQCSDLYHLNLGRVRDREKITAKSIGLIAKYTKVSVLGLAGCDITDECLLLLAKYRGKTLERLSVNNCYRLTNKIVQVYARYCSNLSVFEMKECHWIDDWASVTYMAERNVLLTLSEQQSKVCSEWARRHGKAVSIKAPVK